MKTDKLVWERSRGTFSLSILEKLEVEKSIVFPKEYKAILENYNGAHPSKSLVNIEGNREVVFESLLNWDSSRKANIFFWIECIERETGLSSLIPFGKDPFGNLFCFIFNKKENYEVVFWDHETNKLYRINDSFNSFLCNLY